MSAISNIQANINWDKLPKNAEVIDVGIAYVAVINGVKHVVCWSSYDAGTAQNTLKHLVEKSKLRKYLDERKKDAEKTIKIVLTGK